MGVWEVDERERPRAAALQWPTSDDENAPAAIIFTSGTEGSAKAVVLSHRALLATQQMLLHVTRRLPFHPNPTYGETTLQTGPLFHIGGIGALLRGVMLGNTLVYLSGRFDPGETLGLMERYKITRWNAVPTMASRLIEHPDVRTRDLSALRTLTLGGAPVHAELLARIREALPALDARIATGYGLSENGGQATASSGADTAVRPGSAGRSLPLAEVKIMDRPDKPDGEVLVRSPTQMSGYFGDKKSPIDAEGWLHTGDLGRLDERGHLWITGRSKDIIIRGGENIAPASIERALLGVPGVSEAVVFGVPHPDLGEEVAAIVVVEGEQTAEQLQERVRASVASFAVPSRWRLQREPLPVNQTGKIDKPAIVAGFRRKSQAPRAADQGDRSMRSFQYITMPVRLHHGPDCLAQLPRELDRLGAKRAVIVTGASIARGGSLVELLQTAGGERIAGIIAGARAHSPVPDVQAVAAELKRLAADAVIALGGGSAIVTARGASILMAEHGTRRATCVHWQHPSTTRARSPAQNSMHQSCRS